MFITQKSGTSGWDMKPQTQFCPWHLYVYIFRLFCFFPGHKHLLKLGNTPKTQALEHKSAFWISTDLRCFQVVCDIIYVLLSQEITSAMKFTGLTSNWGVWCAHSTSVLWTSRTAAPVFTAASPNRAASCLALKTCWSRASFQRRLAGLPRPRCSPDL